MAKWNVKQQKTLKTALAVMMGVQEEGFAANVWLITAVKKSFPAVFSLHMPKKPGTGLLKTLLILIKNKITLVF